ncbi:MAG: alpha/beta hydrolase [Clostridiales bacterium]|nr:alpha/beta hydrolase [Clostridiales bacterium]
MVTKSTFKSTAGDILQKRVWTFEGEPKGIVQFAHGMAEHIDRYQDTAERLNKAGYIVVGHNYLGHGKRAKVKGYFADKNGWDALIEDVHAIRQDMQKQYPSVPYFIFGHSMGSMLIRTYCLKHEQGLAGVILSGTGHFDKMTVTAGSLIAKIQCAFGYAKKPSKLIDKISFSAFNNQFKNPRTPNDWLSRDESQVDRYLADEYCGFVFTAGGYRDMFTGLRRLYPENLGAMEKDIPILMFSGALDPVGANGVGVTKVADEIKAVGVTDFTLKLYPDGRHEMLNEINREEVWSDIIAWLDAKLA